MQIDLTPEQDEFVRRAIAAGRIARPEEAVAEALAEWTERERAEFIASLDAAEAEHERGASIRIDTEERRRASVDDIVTRSQARLAARSSPRG